MIKIYLASPFFNQKESCVYRNVIKKLKEIKEVELFIPQDHKVENEWELSNEEWGKAVFEMDVQAIDECDIIIALNWGLYSDTGTAWECGYGYAKGKPIINVLCEKENKEYSLMMINGANKIINLEDVLFNVDTKIKIAQK